jgi:hypothetical protein
MPSSAETVCASSAPVGYALESTPLVIAESRMWMPDSPLWIADSLEIPETLRIHFRAVAWGVALSVLLWISVFFAGHALWSLWR